MTGRGFSHVSLVTLDLDRTRAFYEGVLGFEVIRCDTIDVKEGGQVRHAFFDTGREQLLAFMEPRGLPGVPEEFDAGLNRPLGMPEGFYHFAFEAGTPDQLSAKRAELIAKGVAVTPVVDHGWAHSIYFKDPNGLLLEYACPTCDVHAPDFPRESRFGVSLAAPSPFSEFRDE
jgi:catechol 2,3-dioxygenase-like lactoylglutathione lyase family enzyme